MSFYDAIRVGASGAGDFEIERSVRFNGQYETNPQQIRRTGTSTVSTYTISMWAKNCGVGTGVYRMLFSIGQENDANAGWNGLTDSDTMGFQGGNGTYSTSTQVFRDPSAWFHFLISVNSNNFTTYINGTSIKTGTIRSLDTSTNGIRIGINYGNTYPWDGYIADYYLIDGQALTPSSFTETNALTGQLIPKKYVGSFGTEGAHLKFDDNSSTSALGTDSSGNNNNYTVSGDWSVSAGSGNDSVSDTPTNNFATLNILDNAAANPRNGNLQSGTANTAGWRHTYATFAMPSSGKWYWEVTRQGGAINGSNGICYGLADQRAVELTRDINSNSNNLYLRQSDAQYNNGTYTTPFPTTSVGNVIQFAFDADTGSMWTGVNNTWTGANPSTGNSASWTSIPSGMIPLVGSYGSNNYSIINFGQQGFTYTPPTGYKALNSQNLPDPTILLPNKYFETLLYTGNSTNNRAITGLNFQPDFVWMKKRASSIAQHSLVDSLHGTTDNGSGNGNVGDLDSASNRAPAAQSAGGFESFDANGFTLGKGSNDANADSAYQLNNASGQTYVAWNWNAGDTDSATYRVVVVSDSGNKYRFRNSANTATFAQSAVVLDLAEGGTYTFDQSDSTMSSHPMKLSTTANGTHGGGTSYNTGVTYQLDGSTVTESAFVSGFSSATSRKLIITVAASAPTLYYYCHYHSGMGSSINTNSTLGSSNFDGTIQTTVKASPTSGFSIIRYTGTGSDGTLGHGLGVAPSVYIVKRRSSAKDWYIQVGNLAGIDLGRFLKLNANDGINFASDVFAASADTSTVLNTKSDSATNASGDTYVIYCFSSVEGFSKFGSYTGYLPSTGNGSFVYLGFRPAFLIVKKTASEFMLLTDSKRGAINPIDERLFPAYNFVESDEVVVDFVSNGFKARNGGGASIISGNGSGYVFFAFAESPFKNSRAR